MIKRYRIGDPIPTDAVVKEIPESDLQGFFMAKSGMDFLKIMTEDEIVYGLGENVRGINKRGWSYTSMNTDEPHHHENTHSLYGTHNFLLFDTMDSVKGVFFDTPEKVTFDIGYTKHALCKVSFTGMDVDIYEITGETPDVVIHEFRELIGQSYMAPKWAFGYGQSRWGYRTSDDVREVQRRYEKAGIPLDSIYLDIDYMEGYRDFTINQETFGDFDELVAEMKEKNVHLVPIIDAGVKKDDAYHIYQEGRDNNYFVKDLDGDDFAVGVWPGSSCLPDFLNDDARAWFGNHYKDLIDHGIDGFWNDMNEPAIFYVEKNLPAVFEKLADFRGKNLDVNTFFQLFGLVLGMNNNPENFKLFTHNYRGKKVLHSDVHNLYGYFMTRSASEAFDRICPDKRILMFSRSSYIGMHRYAGIWQGDNLSWWSHLLLNIKMMPSLNMTGFLYTGADLGGFGADTTEDLLIRWLSFAAFTPLMRNHAARGTREQEAYQFSMCETAAGVIRLRYRLIPYLYSEYMKAAKYNTMMFRPMGFVYKKDPVARRVEDQLMLGRELMLAPVYEQNAEGRTVYIPERMEMIRFTGDEITERKVYEKGTYFISMPLGDTCVFLRENRKFVLAPKGAGSVPEIDDRNLKVISFGADPVPYSFYNDDGISK